jgi:hypothetical protein
MGDQNWVIATNALEYLSQQNRRIGQEERRPSISKASDLLGPGIAPFAVTTDDLDGDIAAFNGLWLIEPGALGGPDDTKYWIGQTIADQFTGGWQMFSTFKPTDAIGGEHTVMMRTFSVAPDSPARFYSAWQQVAPIPTVAAPIISGTLAGDDYYEKYDDGRLICAGTHSFPSSANVVQTLTWTFPVTFVGRLPMVTTTPQTTVPQNVSMGINTLALGSVIIEFLRTTAAATTTYYQAEGRWK